MTKITLRSCWLFFNLIAGALSTVPYAGVNIAGFDFGCIITGFCDLSRTKPPGPAGAAQMQRFASSDGQNIFRLPVAWQYLVPSPGAPLNSANFTRYNSLMQDCLATGAKCVIDIHNYARWNGRVIGQSGASTTDDMFADLWAQLGGFYANESEVVMGIMNEPNFLNINRWGRTVQTAVNAIRNAGATTQWILLPGTNFSSAVAFISSGSAAALGAVKNPNTDAVADPQAAYENLYLDIHSYFDFDGSGTNVECTSNKISNAFSLVVQWLRDNNRQGIVTELGGGGRALSCLRYICQALDFFNANDDVMLGWVVWSGGAFSPNYELSVVDAAGVNLPLMRECFVKKFFETTSRVPPSITSTILLGSSTRAIRNCRTTTT